MSSYGRTRTDLKKHKLAPKKRFGQNFLVHKQTAEAIVRAGEVGEDDIITEIGVGLGALTVPMAHQAKHVYGIEIDNGIIKYHEEEQDLPDNVTLIHQDVLKVGFGDLAEKCGGKLKILANLPYSISHPLIFKLIEHRDIIPTATIMLQEEVADRLLAKPGTKEYGIPTILLGCCASIKKKMVLKPAEFHPRPKIDSAVITVDFTKPPELPEYNKELLSRVVRSAFSQRRKTILNTLSSASFFFAEKENKAKNKAMTEKTIEKAGFAVSLRPEVLSIQDFVRLTTVFEQEMNRTEE
ncbi:16S rRNA (adenine(1518)-N(6)/adenine(1519)-N(6))-dimethyltransferase RsmA [Desulfotalea psychrophila]|uniref:Ribosomal RNA small subunit methyltransferase A n=1 Tax=Desulfotalea psychrophila (strain LSv54 / DSM 12343) TaxID=177439 RepID=RSMA_DESPS|nr:16S rRNA (adenine(1518)-N(6)/adenine(1519)-N(6))-dimethyltransferase RsmA [Desulfotalea psychrophila]Q6AL71.1 RecName: Full=Ribosomal RNA small subunit methyltransferase A; AltName: Full=16S rRNA (adenine(1518)-N(6)/adenine(1519)-N(6))-dimethyltransferase; AltName: Full=16S rRNA dimethyladenosine transferase; AltName: Full=16S rRNA dimethylase; AltName: Full=S-adenosylmethionine-6-N', N'-adenosyl(rRNA) dimethyltransferase [Desulfotalea psychrophila LSv54]CAG36904.1 related to dimethyladenosine